MITLDMNTETLKPQLKYTKAKLDYVEFAEIDDIWVRAYTIEKAKSIVGQHVHTHDHITLVSSGTIEAWQDGKVLGQYSAPSIIKIPAGKKHAFIALTDDVVLCCLHNLRGTGLESPELMDKD